MKTIILAREDINNPIHPYLWEQLCEELGLEPKCDCQDYPETITLTVAAAEAD